VSGVSGYSGVALFLIVGQSNAIGRATFDSGSTHPDGTLQWNQSGSAVAATNPLNHVDPDSGDMGLDIEFAIVYLAANPNATLVFIPHAEGGTGLNAGDWPKGGTLYDAAVARANAAIASYGVGLQGIIWHQGERDAAAGRSQVQYGADLRKMILDMRADITGATNVPFVVGEIGSFLDTGTYSTRDAVNLAINETDEKITKTAVVETGDLTDLGDSVHFSAASLRTMGTRYYNAWIAAKANTTAPVIDGLPTISGTVKVGQTVDAVAAAVSPLPATTSWQWRLDGVAISGATSSSYTIIEDDLGGELTVLQSSTGIGGTDTAESTGQTVAEAGGGAIQNAVESSTSDAFWAPTDDNSIMAANSDGTGAVTSTGDPVGRITRVYGTVNLFADAGARPAFDSTTGLLDAITPDNTSNMSVTLSTVSANMYYAFVVDSTSTPFYAIAESFGSLLYACFCSSGSTSTTVSNMGTPTIKVDGVVQTSPTRGSLFTAICDGNKHVVELIGLNVANTGTYYLGRRGAAVPAALYGDFVFCDTPSSGDQDDIRQELADRHGISVI
jgi:hypothetical protein